MRADGLFWDKLDRGEKIIAVELDPPADDSIQPFLDGVSAFQRAGADVITIADSPVGRPRADSCLLSCKLKRELGVEPLPHMACRDRNEIATKALLLGLSIEGVHNVLLVTGDPVPGERREAVKSVFNFTSQRLAQYVSQLNRELFRTPFHIFGALDVNAVNFAAELARAREKERSGMEGFLTQPVLSEEALENLRLARSALKGKLLAGIFPVVSHKNAVFLNTQVSGVRVCDRIIRAYEGADRAEGEALGERISLEVLAAAAPYADGAYLMTPFQRVNMMSRLIVQARQVLR